MRKLRCLGLIATVVVVASAVLATVAAPAIGLPLGRIAFVRFSAENGHPRIFTVGPGAGAPRALPLGVAAATGPVWSRDGRRLAFIGGSNTPGSSDLTGADYLYVWSGGGSRARPLTQGGARIGGAAWSADGKRLVYARSAVTGNLSSLWIVGVGGGKSRRLTTGATDLQPSWSRDGRSIAFTRVDAATYRSGIWLVGPDGHGLRRILARIKNATEPVWSPDGRRLLVEDGRVLYSVRADGSGLRRITALAADAQNAVEDPQAAWSPDGRWIVFCQRRAGATGRSDLWIARSDGRGLRRLTRSPELDRDPSWTP